MSVFIDRLKEIGRVAPQHMGFGKEIPPAQKPKIALVASIAPVNAQDMASGIVGADAALLNLSRLAQGQTLGEISRVMTDIPWGVRVQSGDPEKIEELSRSGCDFVVFQADKMPLSLVQYEKLGKILEVGTSLPDGLLRAINQIQVDAVFLRSEDKPSSLTWHDLMFFRHFADLLSKPLLVMASKEISSEELLVLWETGVDIVVVPVEEAGRTVKELHEQIDGLTFSRKRQEKRQEAILPAFSRNAFREEEEEEEDE
ncbi:MAG: hypothetical protein ABIB93_06660 [Chloroflexota bacterium]